MASVGAEGGASAGAATGAAAGSELTSIGVGAAAGVGAGAFEAMTIGGGVEGRGSGIFVSPRVSLLYLSTGRDRFTVVSFLLPMWHILTSMGSGGFPTLWLRLRNP